MAKNQVSTRSFQLRRTNPREPESLPLTTRASTRVAKENNVPTLVFNLKNTVRLYFLTTRSPVFVFDCRHQGREEPEKSKISSWANKLTVDKILQKTGHGQERGHKKT